MIEPITAVSSGKWLGEKVFDLILGEAWARLMRKRAEEARDILQRKLSLTEVNLTDVSEQDEAAAMVFGYMEAARQGAARRNLVMLADILAGKLATPPIYASDFLRWSRILADLSPEEIITLAKLDKFHNDPAFDQGNDQPKKYSELHKAMWEEMSREGIVSAHLELSGILGALQRTGLVVYSAGGFGGAQFLPTPRLSALLKLIDIEEVISTP